MPKIKFLINLKADYLQYKNLDKIPACEPTFESAFHPAPEPTPESTKTKTKRKISPLKVHKIF